MLAAALLVPAVSATVDTAGPLDVVQAAYVDGIHRNSDADAMRAGFHPDFVMYINGDDGLRTVTRDDWAARIEKAGAEPERETPDISAEMEIVGQSGGAAVVKVELSRDGKHVFTDFLSLYETHDGWMIVAKIFTRHP
jgi:ketosteroid isomerase-like protein